MIVCVRHVLSTHASGAGACGEAMGRDRTVSCTLRRTSVSCLVVLGVCVRLVGKSGSDQSCRAREYVVRGVWRACAVPSMLRAVCGLGAVSSLRQLILGVRSRPEEEAWREAPRRW